MVGPFDFPSMALATKLHPEVQYWSMDLETHGAASQRKLSGRIVCGVCLCPAREFAMTCCAALESVSDALCPLGNLVYSILQVWEITVQGTVWFVCICCIALVSCFCLNPKSGVVAESFCSYWCGVRLQQLSSFFILSTSCAWTVHICGPAYRLGAPVLIGWVCK